MIENKLNDSLSRHYREQTLDSRTLDRLVALTGSHATAGRATAGPRRGAALAALVGLAATVLLALAFVAGYRIGSVGGVDGPPAGGATNAATPRAAIDAAVLPRLVAVNVRADWCARSPKVDPLFAELLEHHRNEPVLFVTLDITDEPRRRQARLMAASLGIDGVFDDPFESGMIKLIDRGRSELLASFTDVQSMAEIEGAMGSALRDESSTGEPTS